MKDAVLDRAVDLAREVAVTLADDPAEVGEHLGVVQEDERLVTHRFACLSRGYRGWEWTVTVARVPRGRVATVCEVALLPGPDAILATSWVPWADRLRPGDIGPGDVLPFRPDDPRLVPGWRPTGDDELDEVAIEELALARARVLSPVGRDEAAQRWYRGARGPTSAGSLASAAACATCGFLVPLQGSLGQLFGVCANEWSPDDGTVVSLDHGCGAHSETELALPSEWPAPDPLIDETAVELVAMRRAPADEAAVEPEVVEPAVDEPAVDDEPDAADEVDDEPDAADEVVEPTVDDEPDAADEVVEPEVAEPEAAHSDEVVVEEVVVIGDVAEPDDEATPPPLEP